MKLCIVFAVVLYTINLAMSGTVVPPDAMKPLIDDCKKEFNVTEADLKDRKGLDDEKKCFHFCVAKKVGYMNEKGDVQLDLFKGQMGKMLSKELLVSVEKCTKDIHDEKDPCVVAQKICLCMHKM